MELVHSRKFLELSRTHRAPIRQHQFVANGVPKPSVNNDIPVIPGIAEASGVARRELEFADRVGRRFARQHGLTPVAGRIAGWLLVCDPPTQTASELARALTASRSAIGAAVAQLEDIDFVSRTRLGGERADRVWLSPPQVESRLVSAAECTAMIGLARAGLRVLEGASDERKQRLLEVVAFYDWVLGRLPALADEWDASRAGQG